MSEHDIVVSKEHRKGRGCHDQDALWSEVFVEDVFEERQIIDNMLDDIKRQDEVEAACRQFFQRAVIGHARILSFELDTACIIEVGVDTDELTSGEGPQQYCAWIAVAAPNIEDTRCWAE